MLTAHLDAAHTGLVWQADLMAPLAARTNRHPSLGGGAVPGYLLAFAGAATGDRRLRIAGAATLGLAVALSLQSAASATVPAANDNASGVAAVLALVEQLAAERPEGLEVVALLNGSEESGMGGMRAFLDAEDLDPRSTLVLGFDSVGSGEMVLLDSEAGPVTKVHYRDADLDWPTAARAVPVRSRCAASSSAPGPIPRWPCTGASPPSRCSRSSRAGAHHELPPHDRYGGARGLRLRGALREGRSGDSGGVRDA